MNRKEEDRIALLKVRSAMRFRFDEHRPAKGTSEEMMDEQKATNITINKFVWPDLVERGLVEFCGGGALRLTDAGKAHLAKVNP